MNRRLGTVARSALAAALVTVLVVPAADARPGGGRSMGSRGSSTYSAPPSTPTAPRSAQPMQRSETPGLGTARPTAPAAQPRRFGFGTGLMAGLLGAGLLGMLTGHGFFGGLAGLASLFGLLVQVALIGGLVWLAFRFFRRRSEPALAAGPVGYGRSSLAGGPLGGMGGAGGQPAKPVVSVGPDDYRAFERSLTEIQLSYGRGDVGAIRRLSTPEMARYLEEELAANRSRGVRNEVSEPKLLQGDLAEAWREGGTDYATVAMRYEIVEAYVDVGSGRVVQGNRTAPTEVTEIWTFRRDEGGGWLLSAIQQTA